MRLFFTVVLLLNGFLATAKNPNEFFATGSHGLTFSNRKGQHGLLTGIGLGYSFAKRLKVSAFTHFVAGQGFFINTDELEYGARVKVLIGPKSKRWNWYGSFAMSAVRNWYYLPDELNAFQQDWNKAIRGGLEFNSRWNAYLGSKIFLRYAQIFRKRLEDYDLLPYEYKSKIPNSTLVGKVEIGVTIYVYWSNYFRGKK